MREDILFTLAPKHLNFCLAKYMGWDSSFDMIGTPF